MNQFVLALLALGVLGVPACLRDDELAGIFCDYADEGCGGPAYFTCAGVRCVDAVGEGGACVAKFGCEQDGDDMKCVALDLGPGFVDNNACIRNNCVNGQWVTVPRPEIDDGDPCTQDYCYAHSGTIEHYDICP